MITSSTIRGRSVPGAGCVLAITPNWIMRAPLSTPGVEGRPSGRSWAWTPIDQPPRLALAAVSVLGQAACRDELDGDPDAEVRLEPVLQDVNQALTVPYLALGLHPHRHVVAKIEPGGIPLDDAQPLPGGAVVGGHRADAGHGEDVGPADLHHVVAAAQEMVHLAGSAATAAARRAVAHDPDVVPEVVADQRRVVAVEAGHHQVALLAVGHELIGVHVCHFDDEHVLHEVQAV